MFLRGPREIARRSFPDMQSMLRILGHFPPRQLCARPNAKGPDYEELVIPERLRSFNVSLSTLGLVEALSGDGEL